MATPDYWPDDGNFKSFDSFFQDPNAAQGVQHIAGLAVVNNLLNNKFPVSQSHYTVAELSDQSQIWALINSAVSQSPFHGAGYGQDKYFPANSRFIKNTPAGPGQTVGKTIKEFLTMNRLKVHPGDWGAQLVLVCKNNDRWTKFEDCRRNFDLSGVDATNDMQGMQWYTGVGGNQGYPVIDAKRGECYLWVGQSLDILHACMTNGFQRIHCQSNNLTGYGALGRGNYFTDKFSKALLYAINLRNQYFGKAKGEDIRVLMLARVLLGNYMTMDNKSKQERQDQRFAHNLELTGSAQRDKRLNDPSYVDYEQSVALYRDNKLLRTPKQKGWKQNYQIQGQNRDANIGKESVHLTHKGSNEFCVAMGKQVYPEFLVFVGKN